MCYKRTPAHTLTAIGVCLCVSGWLVRLYQMHAIRTISNRLWLLIFVCNLIIHSLQRATAQARLFTLHIYAQVQSHSKRRTPNRTIIRPRMHWREGKERRERERAQRIITNNNNGNNTNSGATEVERDRERAHERQQQMRGNARMVHRFQCNA